VNQTQPETPGPYGCKTKDECNSYCNRKPFECKAWCKVKKDICNAYSLAVDTESKIPGNPCTQDTDCHEGLICLDYKCDIPTPDKIEQKAEFKLPGNQSTMEECSQYCINPENNLECAGFCKKLPIFCGHSINQDTEETPEEPTPDEQDNPNLETKNQTRSQTLNQTNNEGHGNTLTFYVI
jgi:hypothetical protein